MAYIKQKFIEDLLADARIEEIIGRFVKLKKAGANYKGLSPFTKERTGSFVVSPVKDLWKDFSSGKCGKLVNFIMEHKPCDYPEAIKIIAECMNRQVEFDTEEVSVAKREKLEQKEELRKTLLAAYELYRKEFEKLPENHPAKEEVARRGYGADEVIEWGIGFAPENFLHDKLAKSGKLQHGIDMGLVKDGENKWDKYTNRVIYPIHDKNGLLVGLAGRDITGSSKAPKWINPDVNDKNLLYDKSRVLFGLHKAKYHIKKMGFAVICEGYNDVIAFQKYGLLNTVSSSGTAITQGHLTELYKLTDKILFAMDPDDAGRRSMIKYIPEAIKMGFTTEVALINQDPDDFCRAHAQEFEKDGALVAYFQKQNKMDGFKLLIQEFIQKPYLQVSQELESAKLRLKEMTGEYQSELESLKKKEIDFSNDYDEAFGELKIIEAKSGKKSQEYLDQNILVVQAKTKLSKIKTDIKNYKPSPEYVMQNKLIANLDEKLKDEFEHAEPFRKIGAQKLCQYIAYVKDKAYREIYSGWLKVESGLSAKNIADWIKEYEDQIEVPTSFEYSYSDKPEYILPKDVHEPLEKFEKDIINYGMFMANCKIYFAGKPNDDNIVSFYVGSNFEIEVLQHMKDEKFPMKLIRVKNIHGEETVFDAPSEFINTPQAFDNTVTGHGNFRFDGNRSDLLRLRKYLMDKMGNGKKIEVLGRQPDGGFHVWNNLILLDNQEEKEISDDGIFVHNNVYYYIPSANKIYRSNPYKFEAQKKFIREVSSINMALFFTQAMKVHRHHFISALLFAMSSMFRDHIALKLNRFPILFLYGPGGTGKDELAEIVQGFTGKPQTAINLEGDVSTIKASIRELAQFRNGISQFSEYKRGNKQHDGVLKQIYDIRGYKRGTIESHVGTESVPVESSVILTGNDFPEAEALIQRLIWNEMTKNNFNDDELKAFDILKDMMAEGISGFAHEILKHRLTFVENFEKKQRSWKGILKERFPEAKERMIANLSILSATYEIFRDVIKFPFTQDQMMDHFGIGIDQQLRKINAASVMVKFWECFISSMRGNPEDRIQAKRIVNIEGDLLYIQWTHVFAKIQKQWYVLYHEAAPNKATILEQIEKEPGLLHEKITAYSYDSGRDGVRSSALCLNLKAMSENLKSDIVGSFMFQLNEGTIFDPPQKSQPQTSMQEALPLQMNSSDSDQEDTPF